MPSLGILSILLPVLFAVSPDVEEPWAVSDEDLFSTKKVVEPIYLASEERSALPGRFRFRGASFGLGGAIYFNDVCCDPELCRGASRCEAGRRPPMRLEVTPLLDVLTEFGWRHVRAVLGVFTLPKPHLYSDAALGLLLGVQGGIFVGHERLRVGVTAGGGYLGYQVLGRLLVLPWRSDRGHRHGLEAAIGRENWTTTIMFAYRFAPAALNQLGGRRAAKRRAGG